MKRIIALVLAAALLSACNEHETEWPEAWEPTITWEPEIAWHCNGTIIGYANKDLGPSTAGRGPDGRPIGNDDETTIWVIDPPREGFVFKQKSTPHAYGSWSAELDGEPCDQMPVDDAKKYANDIRREL